MVRGGRDHCGTRIPSFYDADDDGDDVDVDEKVRILFQSTWLG